MPENKDEIVKQRMNKIAKCVDGLLPINYGFILLKQKKTMEMILENIRRMKMISNLDMNICTEVLKKNRCMSCKQINETNHYIVAEKSIIILCTDCLEKLCIRGIERVGYKSLNKKIYIKGRKKIYEKKI